MMTINFRRTFSKIGWCYHPEKNHNPYRSLRKLVGNVNWHIFLVPIKVSAWRRSLASVSSTSTSPRPQPTWTPSSPRPITLNFFFKSAQKVVQGWPLLSYQVEYVVMNIVLEFFEETASEDKETIFTSPLWTKSSTTGCFCAVSHAESAMHYKRADIAISYPWIWLLTCGT